jgi:SAM-dependent methyltransferase
LATHDVIEECLQGKKLYGDDFPPGEIDRWYQDEEEGYADLGAKDRTRYSYGYHALNHAHAFRHLPPRNFAHVLSLGGAYGEELRPLLPRAGKITILDPSVAFTVKEIAGVPVEYVKPQPSGLMPFPDELFDLATCFGCLHHVPNVSTVVREVFRSLRPSGIALIREPTVSMGDWRRPRVGLTRRERGLPLSIFRRIVQSAGFTVVKERRCVFPLIIRLRPLFGGPVYNSPTAVWLDGLLSWLFSWNSRYHCVNPLQKLQPTVVAFVLQKPEEGGGAVLSE